MKIEVSQPKYNFVRIKRGKISASVDAVSVADIDGPHFTLADKLNEHPFIANEITFN